MKQNLILILAMCMVGCASGDEKTAEEKQLEAVKDRDRIEDFVTSAELEEVEEARTRTQLNHKILTDEYIILSDRKSRYLLHFTHRCRELYEHTPRPDYRTERNVIRAKFDTYRGCRIKAMYQLTGGQEKELLALDEMSE